MSLRIDVRRALLLPTPKVQYLLYDGFFDARAATAVNNTYATPPASVQMTAAPSLRTVVDTESKLSIANGVLTFAGGKASPAWGNPGLWYPSATRVAGKIQIVNITITTITSAQLTGYGIAQTGILGSNSFRIAASGIITPRNSVGYGPALGTLALATSYQLALVLRAAGAFHYVKGGTFVTWTLLWIDDVDIGATLYPAIINYDNVFTADNIRIPSRLWLPAPLVSDAFSGTRTGLGQSDGLGHTELNGGGGVVWQHDAGVWALSGGAAVGTPTLGAELSSGNLVVGNWYSITLDTLGSYFFTGSATGNTFRATATTSLTVLEKVKLATLSSLIAVTPSISANVLAEAAIIRTLGTQAGLCLRCNSQAAPTDFLLAYLDGTGNVKLDKCVAGVYTNLISAAVIYVASAVLRVILSGTSVNVFYNNLAVGTTQTVNDVTSTLHGLFSTYALNSFDNLVIWDRGTGGAYASLDAM